jgi:hypothetical protein
MYIQYNEAIKNVNAPIKMGGLPKVTKQKQLRNWEASD